MVQFLLALLLVGQAYAFAIPPNDGYVTDTAGVLSESEEPALEATIDAFRRETSNEIAILIVSTLNGEAIADVAVEVGRAWGVGLGDRDNGIVILIARDDREVFIATGYGLEGAVPDIVAKGIIDTDILPAFRNADYAGGLLGAVASLQSHIGGEYTAERYEQGDGSDWGPGVFVLFILFQILAGILGRTKSWWLGGVLGAVLGVILTVLFGWWLSIPALTVLGLIIDYIVSRSGGGGGRGTGVFPGGWSSGSGSGGFGGFGGGSFGGGGAGGRW